MMVHARSIHEGGSGSLFWSVSGIILVAIGSVALLTQPWSGFNNLKDILDVIAIPLVIAFVSAWLPRSMEAAKIEARKVEFTDLVYREIQEAGPFKGPSNEDKKLTKWSCHLQKRFLHDAIFKDPKENMDFILSLDPDLVYHVSQLWMHYDKAHAAKVHAAEDQVLAHHADQWLWHLYKACEFLDKYKDGAATSWLRRRVCKKGLVVDIYCPWFYVVQSYHPDVPRDKNHYQCPAKEIN